MHSEKIVIAAANRLFRDGLKQVLRKARMSVVSEGGNAAEILANMGEDVRPDLAICHLNPEQKPEEWLLLVRDLRRNFPDSKLVVLAEALPNPCLMNLAGSGADAFLLTDISSQVLHRSLELILLGQHLFPPNVMPLLASIADAQRDDPSAACAAPEPPPEGRAQPASATGSTQAAGHAPALDRSRTIALSDREQQIMRCLVVGWPNKLIARELNITEATVKVHIKGLLRKIRARNRTQAAIWALNNCYSPESPAAATSGQSGSADPLPADNPHRHMASAVG